MSNYHFKYGSGAVDLNLPDNGHIEVLQGKAQTAIADIGAALKQAVEYPVGHEKLNAFLAKGDAVTLIISDMSRFWMRQDLVIPHLVNYIQNDCGIEDLAILVANGTHIGGDEKDLRTLVTDEIFDRVRVLNHDCLADDLVHVGATSYGTDVTINPLAVGRKIIALGAATQHVMAGFGGGRKSILPGISSMKTIQQNHALSLDPDAPRSNPKIGNSVLIDNPLNGDMCEAADMIPHFFVINLVMNTDMQLSKITAGHWRDSWLSACDAVQAMYALPIRELADVIITSCGGYPKDMSLYQGTKTIDNVETGLKIGGTLVLIAECREGGGPAEYFDWLQSLERGTLDSDLRANFTIPGYIFYLNCEQAQRYNIVMLTTADKDALSKMGIKAYSDPETLMLNLDLDDQFIYVIPNGATVIPTTV